MCKNINILFIYRIRNISLLVCYSGITHVVKVSLQGLSHASSKAEQYPSRGVVLVLDLLLDHGKFQFRL